MNKALLTTILLALTSPCFAEESKTIPLEGSMYIWGEHLEKKTSDLEGFNIFITGEAAKSLYNKMQVTPAHNECYDDGTLTKTEGMFECNLSAKGTYDCNFGVDTKNNKITGAESC